ncbi:MAG: penicillin-binding protein 2 [bacterium]|nr:penicillin-binding protein 2 [bacterium]
MKNWRINLIILFFFGIGAVIANRLFFLQIKNHDFYKALAQGQQADFKTMEADRGSIFFSDGQLLVADGKYPLGLMASTVSGFIGGEGVGQYGVEGFYEEKLREKEDIFLTIDYNVQFIAEDLLKRAGETLGIKGGQIIIMDPNSGKIIALADYPGFDPNNYFKVDDFSVFQNSATQKLFEPGSTLKPIVMAAALDKEKITPETIFVDTGSVKINGKKIENYGGRVFGESTMTQVLEKSINTGVVFVERKTGHEIFLDYLKRFGFFEPTGVDIQGEVYSENKQLKKGSDINFATASFGQGIEITPIQLAGAFCAIANGGNLVKPYLAGKTMDGKGNIIESTPQFLKEKIISLNTASKLSAMLVSVIENGYSKTAGIPGYYIAGKTGTAQISWSALGVNKKGYSAETWQSFIGFFPAFSPKFVVLVKLDNPKASTAEYSAAPIFKEMSQYLINYYSIPPDYE